MLKRLLAPLLTLLLLAGVGTAIYVSVTNPAGNKTAADSSSTLHEIKGVIGSEKEEFFHDPQTIAALAKIKR